MRPATKPLPPSHWLSQAAAEIEHNKLDAQQSRGVMAKYDLDGTWIDDNMSSIQVANAAWTRAETARYLER